MARHGHDGSSTLLSRWLSTGPREEVPVRPASAAAETPETPVQGLPERTAADVLHELEDSLAERLPADRVKLVSSLLDPIRAALEPDAKVDRDGLVKLFDQLEDLLEAFLLVSEDQGGA